MAYLRQALLFRQRLLASRLPVRSWQDTDVNPIRDGDNAFHILPSSPGRKRVDEVKTSVQAEHAVHDA